MGNHGSLRFLVPPILCASHFMLHPTLCSRFLMLSSPTQTPVPHLAQAVQDGLVSRSARCGNLRKSTRPQHTFFRVGERLPEGLVAFHPSFQSQRLTGGLLFFVCCSYTHVVPCFLRSLMCWANKKECSNKLFKHQRIILECKRPKFF